MMEIFEGRLPIVLAVATVAASVLLGLLARRFVLGRLAVLAARTQWAGDDALLGSLRRPLPVWFFLAGLHVASRIVELPPDAATLIDKVLLSILILSVTFWAANLCARLLELRALAHDPGAGATSGVVRNVAQIAVVAVGVLVLLNTLGISITPILTTVGIGGLAVALGLQETLANLFAGMHMTLAGNIRVGDFIRLESGEEGQVDDVHWRATRVRTLANNFVLIPNSRLAQSVVTNYNFPSKETVVVVQAGVRYGSDLDAVERVACDVGRDVMTTVEGGVPEFQPVVRFHTFADSRIDFSVALRVREYTDASVIKHAFMKALSRRFAAEGIVMPFPIRAINLDQENARPVAFGT